MYPTDMDPNYLTEEEIGCELKARGKGIVTAVEIQRNVFRRFLKMEGKGGSFEYTVETNQEHERCHQKLTQIASELAHITSLPLSSYQRYVSRTTHLNNCLQRLPVFLQTVLSTLMVMILERMENLSRVAASVSYDLLTLSTTRFILIIPRFHE